MTVQLDDETLRLQLVRIATTADAQERKNASHKLVEELHRMEALEVWGRNLARKFDRQSEGDEFTSVISMALLELIPKLTVRDIDRMSSVPSFLFYRSKSAVQSWLDSAAVTFASKMSGISRRHRIARVAARELREKLNREPEAAEVVEYVNENLLRTRKDAVKQGVLISVDDVDGVLLRTYSMDYQTSDDDEDGDHFGTPSDEGVTTSAEVAITLAQLRALVPDTVASADVETVRRVLDAWVGWVSEGETPSSARVMRTFGFSRREASRYLNAVNAVLAEFRDKDDDAA